MTIKNKLLEHIHDIENNKCIEIERGECCICKEKFEPLEGRVFGGWVIHGKSYCGFCADILCVATRYDLDAHK